MVGKTATFFLDRCGENLHSHEVWLSHQFRPLLFLVDEFYIDPLPDVLNCLPKDAVIHEFKKVFFEDILSFHPPAGVEIDIGL